MHVYNTNIHVCYPTITIIKVITNIQYQPQPFTPILWSSRPSAVWSPVCRRLSRSLCWSSAAPPRSCVESRSALVCSRTSAAAAALPWSRSQAASPASVRSLCSCWFRSAAARPPNSAEPSCLLELWGAANAADLFPVLFLLLFLVLLLVLLLLLFLFLVLFLLLFLLLLPLMIQRHRLVVSLTCCLLLTNNLRTCLLRKTNLVRILPGTILDTYNNNSRINYTTATTKTVVRRATRGAATTRAATAATPFVSKRTNKIIIIKNCCNDYYYLLSLHHSFFTHPLQVPPKTSTSILSIMCPLWYSVDALSQNCRAASHPFWLALSTAGSVDR